MAGMKKTTKTSTSTNTTNDDGALSSSSPSSSNSNTRRVIIYAVLINCVVITIYSSMSITNSSMSKLLMMKTDTDDNTYNSNMPKEYVPSTSEQYILDHSTELGYASENNNPKGCTIWDKKNSMYMVSPFTAATTADAIWKKNQNVAMVKVTNDLHSFQNNMNLYNKAVQNFEPIPDLLKLIIQSSKEEVEKAKSKGITIGTHLTRLREKKNEICAMARLHPDGIQAMFSNSNNNDNNNTSQHQHQHQNDNHQLSYTPTSGYLEPLLPPLRDPRICFNDDGERKHFMSLDYLLHDFEHMCRHSLQPTSRRIFIDMGASLSFHGGAKSKRPQQPVVRLLKLYEKFGFYFDHIYGFEITHTAPTIVYNTLLPEKYIPIYHWINVGVNHKKGHRLNPLHSILNHYNEDDFIVVKLDIDTSWIELPLAHQLLEGGKDGIYHKLVDQFYFEEHVHLGELATSWGKSMVGSIKNSLELFQGLRKKGIPAHYWP